MKLIKATDNTAEGNEAIRQINIYLLEKEIIKSNNSIVDYIERGEISAADEAQETLDEELDQLEELDCNHKFLELYA